MADRFKLDVIALLCAVEGAPDPGAIVSRACIELSRQLHAAGAPDAPLEEQLRTLLASHVALREAAAALPSAESIGDAIYERSGGTRSDEGPWYDACRAARVALDLFRAPFARLTQERDEARALVADRERNAGRLATELCAAAEVAANRHAEAESLRADLATLSQAHEEALRERDEARAERDMANESVRLNVGAALGRAEAVALRQRAERAEELAAERLATANHDARTMARRETAELHGRVATLEAERAALRARVAELEGRAEPGADMVEMVRNAINAVARLWIWEPEKYAKAAISALAAMGEEAWPSEDDLRGPHGMGPNGEGIPGIVALYHSRLAPVIGALRARVGGLEAQPTGPARDVATYSDGGRSSRCRVCGMPEFCKRDCPRRS